MKTLLALKAKYKTATGADWKPGLPTATGPAATGQTSATEALSKRLEEAEAKLEQLKADKVDKVREIDRKRERD